jgi:site-specific DNA-methyltransferase (cytosine-N4-specific)
MTGRVAETLQRKWLAFEIDRTYLDTSKIRFEPKAPLVVEPPSELLADKQVKNGSSIAELPLFSK